MKKFFCLLMICIFSLGTIALAADAESVEISCTERNNIAQYAKLLKKSKQEILKILPHIDLTNENVSANDSCLGVSIYFTKDNNQEVAKRITIKSALVKIKEAKIGDNIDKFKESFNEVIDKNSLVAYSTFSYRDKALTAFYSPTDQIVKSVVITENTSKKNNRHEIKIFDEKVNGIYLGKNLEYVLSEKRKHEALERAIKENYTPANAMEKISYYYNYVDLNDDGNMEVVLYLQKATRSEVIDSSVLVLSPQDNGKYTVLGNFSVVQNPIIISENKTNGWRDIIMGLPGNDVAEVLLVAKFAESQYHRSLDLQTSLQEGQVIFGKAVIADNTAIRPGIKI